MRSNIVRRCESPEPLARHGARNTFGRARPLPRSLLIGAAAACTIVVTAAPVHSAAALSGSSAGAGPAVMATDDDPVARGAVPHGLAVALELARNSLTHTVSQLNHGRYVKAAGTLHTLAERVARANHAASNQIGKPPSDPESDDPPGPPSVLAAMRLEHTVCVTLVPQFDDMNRPRVVNALRVALRVTQHRRDDLLDAVLAQKPGARGDYADGMADTLSWYPQEINQLTNALSTFQLEADSRTALEEARERVQATKQKIDAAFGGGE
jgi:hypothetical protein